MSSTPHHSHVAKRWGLAVVLASIVLLATSIPAGAVSTPQITGGECDLETGSITVTWSGKDPYWFAAEWDDFAFGHAIWEQLVTRAADRVNSFTESHRQAVNHSPITVTLYGKPHGNDNIAVFGEHGGAERLDRIVLTCN